MIPNINGQYLDPTYRLPGEDLDSYVGHAVELSGTTVVPLSDTDQATTQTVYGLGVLRDSGSFANNRGVQIWTCLLYTSDAAEDGTFTFLLNRRQVNLDGGA